MAKNFLPRFIGANLLAGLFVEPHDGEWWLKMLAHLLIVLALMLLTSPEPDQ